ncbi:MAG: hypothetical protein Kow0098_09400 [Ignavibacteriaceae bacterium]
MKKIFLLFVFSLAANLFAQYPEVTIHDIQYQNPDSLNIYFDDDMVSPYDGDTVVVTGVVMTAPYKSLTFDPDSILIYVGTGAAGFYMQDTALTDWSGILVRQDPSLGPPFSELDSGSVVKITGIVNEYSTSTQKTTQFNVINFTGQNVIGQIERPQPVELTLDSLKELGTNNDKAIAEKWEGVYVIIRDVTTFDRNGSTGSFRIKDANGTEMYVGTKSNYFYVPSSGFTPPADGSYLEYIKGYIETRSPSSNGVTLNPGYPDDLLIVSFPPVITDVERDKVFVNYGEPVTVSCYITDVDGTVDVAQLKYRINGGTLQQADMTNVSDSTYQAVIPGQNDSSLVDFFIYAEDNEANVAMNPSDTSNNRYFYFVLDHEIDIQHVQYSPFGSGFGAFNGYEVTVDGIITSDTSDLGTNIHIQNGTGPWSGIEITGTETLLLNRGDLVEVTGTVTENFGMTRITGLDNPGSVNVISTGNPLPEAESVSTAEINQLSGGTVQAEQWEAVLIKYENITVTDENADGDPGPNGNGNSNFGEMLVADLSGVNTRVNLDDGNHIYHNFWDSTVYNIPGNIYVQTGDQFTAMSGILYYTFGQYKLNPRKNDDFEGYLPSDVKTIQSVPDKFELSQNYPNPFNPSTVISYSLPRESKVMMKVYNILGQEIITLVNQTQPAGSYKVSFDASSLSSGIYFYSLQTDGFNQVRKMMLLK